MQAYAAARMAESVLLGLGGKDDVYECAYVESSITKLPFFASKVIPYTKFSIMRCKHMWLHQLQTVNLWDQCVSSSSQHAVGSASCTMM